MRARDNPRNWIWRKAREENYEVDKEGGKVYDFLLGIFLKTGCLTFAVEGLGFRVYYLHEESAGEHEGKHDNGRQRGGLLHVHQYCAYQKP